jgi:hypothetical protein
MALPWLPNFPDKYLPAGNFSRCDAFMSENGTLKWLLTRSSSLQAWEPPSLSSQQDLAAGWYFTKAAFDDRPAPNRADPAPAPRMRVILPAYAEPAAGVIAVPDQSQTDTLAKPEVQPARQAATAVAQVEKADLRKAERQSRIEARRQAERKVRKIAAARAKPRLEAQRREEPAIMAFGGDSPHLFGN